MIEVVDKQQVIDAIQNYSPYSNSIAVKTAVRLINELDSYSVDDSECESIHNSDEVELSRIPEFTQLVTGGKSISITYDPSAFETCTLCVICERSTPFTHSEGHIEICNECRRRLKSLLYVDPLEPVLD